MLINLKNSSTRPHRSSIILTQSNQAQDRNQNSQAGSQEKNQNQNRKRNNNAKHDGPKREAILDLNKYKDQKIRVKFIGGRQITGTLTGFDQLMNLVLEDVEETIAGMYRQSFLSCEILTQQLKMYQQRIEVSAGW